MGGSSLAPEVLRETFGVAKGGIEVGVLDSTDPASVQAALKRSKPEKTLYIVSSKSGGTIEVMSFFKFFYEKVKAVKGDKAGENFIAITDPDTSLEKLAKEKISAVCSSTRPTSAGATPRSHSSGLCRRRCSALMSANF